jgi:hypothetical protein
VSARSLTNDERLALERDIAVVQRYTGGNVRDAWDAAHGRKHPGTQEHRRVARWDDERVRKALAAAVVYEGIAARQLGVEPLDGSALPMARTRRRSRTCPSSPTASPPRAHAASTSSGIVVVARSKSGACWPWR